MADDPACRRKHRHRRRPRSTAAPRPETAGARRPSVDRSRPARHELTNRADAAAFSPGDRRLVSLGSCFHRWRRRAGRLMRCGRHRAKGGGGPLVRRPPPPGNQHHTSRRMWWRRTGHRTPGAPSTTLTKRFPRLVPATGVMDVQPARSRSHFPWPSGVLSDQAEMASRFGECRVNGGSDDQGDAR
ncbi:hypothetical protein BJY14_007997 [Actinomadura luteofluorescens]|uniref:Uncharacterized protein n=1 Tax=Actinomadura luteofluorescens TaxID=46163 RepID=A0A7Y9JLY8_9ACTN|nr:hypothetical protein [Actinomadura luteofluorescens]